MASARPCLTSDIDIKFDRNSGWAALKTDLIKGLVFFYEINGEPCNRYPAQTATQVIKRQPLVSDVYCSLN
jgi:hypothetical protein